MSVDLSLLRPGDTVCWRTRPRGYSTRAWGLVEWVDEKGVHVSRPTGSNHPRYIIKPERLLAHFPGNAEFWKHGRAIG